MTANARQLPREAAPAERALWHALREHRPRFTRQLVVSHFIVDIACRSLKIAVELDGGHHAEQVTRDEARSVYLRGEGWTVLRFWNNEVLNQLEGVVATIIPEVARASTHPRPLPFREGRR